MNPFHISDGILSDFILCRSCACSHRHCEFLHSMTLSHPTNTLSLQTSTASGSYNLSIPSSTIFLEPWEEEYDIDVSFRTEHFIVSYSMQFIRFCINLHLLKKVSLMKVES